jgi:hypothetical protein
MSTRRGKSRAVSTVVPVLLVLVILMVVAFYAYSASIKPPEEGEVGDIQVNVMNETGSPIRAVRLRLYGKNLTEVNPQVRGGTTNAQGQWNFTKVPVGCYDIRTEKSGFEINVGWAVVETNQTAIVEIFLKMSEE